MTSRPKVRRKGKKVEIDEATQREIMRLSRIGHSLTKISELTGYSRWTIDRVKKETHSQGAVERERKASIVPVEPPVKTAESIRADSGPPVKSIGDYESLPDFSENTAAEISSKVSSAVDVARAMTQDMEKYTKSLEALWERAEHVAQMEISLTGAIETFRLMKHQLDAYKQKIDELEAKNVERALAVNSEGSLTGRR